MGCLTLHNATLRPGFDRFAIFQARRDSGWVVSEITLFIKPTRRYRSRRFRIGIPYQLARLFQIVTRAVPVVQDFSGFLKILKPNLAVSDHCLVLLYQRGEQGAEFKEIEKLVRPQMRANLGTTLKRLTEQKDRMHFDGSRYFITRLGQQEAETRHLVEPIL